MTESCHRNDQIATGKRHDNIFEPLPWYVIASVVTRTVLLGSVLTIASLPAFAQSRFQVEEATIDDVQEAIQ